MREEHHCDGVQHEQVLCRLTFVLWGRGRNPVMIRWREKCVVLKSQYLCILQYVRRCVFMYSTTKIKYKRMMRSSTLRSGHQTFQAAGVE